jgi:hypothetical protein
MPEQSDKKETKKAEEEAKDPESQPFCTTAPSAEHARADDEDEPCDDGRAGGKE